MCTRKMPCVPCNKAIISMISTKAGDQKHNILCMCFFILKQRRVSISHIFLAKTVLMVDLIGSWHETQQVQPTYIISLSALARNHSCKSTRQMHVNSTTTRRKELHEFFLTEVYSHQGKSGHCTIEAPRTCKSSLY